MTWPLYVPFPVELGAATFASRPAATTILTVGPNLWFQAFAAPAAPWVETNQWWGPFHTWTHRQDHAPVIEGIGISATGILHGPFGAAAITMDDATIAAADISPVTADPISGRKIPATPAQWYRFASGLAIPDLMYPQPNTLANRFTELVVGATATGATGFSPLATPSTRAGVQLAELSGNFYSPPIANLVDLSTTSIMIAWYGDYDNAPGSNDEALLSLGINGAVFVGLDHNSLGKIHVLRVNGTLSGGVAGSSIADDGFSHMHVLRWNVTAGTVTYFTDYDKIVGTYTPIASSKIVTQGQNGTDPSAGQTSAGLFIWTGAHAEVADAVVASMMQSVGLTVTGWTWVAHGVGSTVLGDGGPGGDGVAIAATGTVTGGGATGTAAITLGDETIVATGVAPSSGAGANTIGDVTDVGTGSAPAKGSASNTLGDVTDAATGSAPARGAASVSLDDVTDTATGVVNVKGTASVGLDDVTDTGTGTVEVQGAASTAVGDVTDTATGTVEVQGSGANTLGDVTVSATGSAPAKGTLAETLGDVTATATGSAPAAGVAGVTLGDVTDTGSGTVEVQGAASVAVGDITSSGAGTIESDGAASISLDDVTIAATGTVDVAGAGATTLGDVTSVGTGTVEVKGAASIALDDVASSSTGTVAVTGEGDVPIGDVDASGDGTVTTPGGLQLHETLGDVSADATGTVLVQGDASVELGDVGVDATGAVTAVGEGDATLGDVVVEATGVAPATGTGDNTIGDVDVIATGGQGAPFVPPTFLGASGGDGMNLRSKSRAKGRPAPHESTVATPIVAAPIFELGNRVRLAATFETKAGMRFDPSRVVATTISSKGSRRFEGRDVVREAIGSYSIDVALDVTGPLSVRFDGYDPDATMRAEYLVRPARRASTASSEAETIELARTDAAKERRKKMVEDLTMHGVAVDETRSDAYLEGQHGELSRRLMKERHVARAAWGK